MKEVGDQANVNSKDATPIGARLVPDPDWCDW